MSRDLTSAVATLVQTPRVTPIVLYEGVWTAGTLRFWSGFGDREWDGKTWTGAGQLLSISPAEETTQLRAAALTVSLNGMTPEIIATVLQYAATGLAGTLWLGFLDSSNNIVADPYVMFKGRMDVPSIEDNGATCSIAVSYESRLIDLERASDRRWTHEDQQIEFPGDKGFQYVGAIMDRTITWGGRPTIPFNSMKDWKQVVGRKKV